MYLLISHRSTKELMSSKKKSDETECSLDFIMEAIGGKLLSATKHLQSIFGFIDSFH